MFEFLKAIDTRLYDRYLTVEGNVKSASNSFYDSYLDLQEQFVKFVALDFGIDVSMRETCGSLLKRKEIESIFLQKLATSQYVYSKMGDYTLKVNAHKHVGEKSIHVETIVNYMLVLHGATSAFAAFKQIDCAPFDGNYFIDIFGSYQKENAKLKEEVISLKEELSESVEQRKLKDSDIDAYRGLLSQAEIDKMSLEEQNSELQRQISKLKDIKLSSMEEKLNKTIDLLLELKPAIEENRQLIDLVRRRIG